MKIRHILLISLVVITSPHLQAVAQVKEQSQVDRVFLARISTDYVKKTYDLFIDLNNHKLISAITTRNNKKNKIKTYPVSVLKKPITLVKAVGITLISLSCTNFTTSKGCDITIEYPYNLTYGKFKKFKAKLKKKDREWVLVDEKDNVFNQLFLKAKKALGLLVGIKRITPGYKDDLKK